MIFDLSITPNRPDAMCIVGVARELAAHFKLPLDVPEPKASTDTAVANDISVVIEAPDRCPRYLGRVARVTMGESPAWMAQRLVKAGMRPISNVVDVTNYVLLERNQPLHAFDLARLGGRGIVVRLANDGEHITTLDGVDRELTADDLLICDAERAPQAVAGIMGGSTAEVSDTTSEILLESAYFEPDGDREDVEAAEAPQRVECTLRAWHRPRRRRPQRGAGDGAPRRRGRRARRTRQ